MITYQQFIKDKPTYFEATDLDLNMKIKWGDNWESFLHNKKSIVKIYQPNRRTHIYEFESWIEMWRFVEGFQWVK